MDDLDAEIMSAVASIHKGRPRSGTQLHRGRDLVKEDIELLENPRGIQATPLQKLRHSHHMIARLMAEGTRAPEISAITGYSQVRVHLLKQDPSFQELVAYYAQQTEAKYLDLHERLATVGTDAVEVLQERLDEDPDQFSNKELRELAGFALERSGRVDTPQTKAGSGAITINFVSPSILKDITPQGQVLEIDLEP